VFASPSCLHARLPVKHPSISKLSILIMDRSTESGSPIQSVISGGKAFEESQYLPISLRGLVAEMLLPDSFHVAISKLA
jgi:hypothetical protein